MDGHESIGTLEATKHTRPKDLGSSSTWHQFCILHAMGNAHNGAVDLAGPPSFLTSPKIAYTGHGY